MRKAAVQPIMKRLKIVKNAFHFVCAINRKKML